MASNGARGTTMSGNNRDTGVPARLATSAPLITATTPGAPRAASSRALTVRAELLDDELEIARAVAERIDPDAPRVFPRRLRNRRRPLRAHVPAVIETAQRERKGAAAVREADPEPRQALEHAAEDQRGDRERGLKGIADDEREVVLRQPLLPREGRGRVDEHRDAHRRARLEEGKQRRIIEVAAARARADLHGAQRQSLARV